MRKLGLVDYWRAKAWPQYRHPVGANGTVLTDQRPIREWIQILALGRAHAGLGG
jgi:hypothetical protein